MGGGDVPMYRQELYRTRRADYRSEGGGVAGADLRFFGLRPLGLLLLGPRLRGLLLLGLLLRPPCIHASAQVKSRMCGQYFCNACTAAAFAHCVFTVC
eukprot:scaffold24096_cov64-Phaeocystis_antarctica.AAC.8